MKKIKYILFFVILYFVFKNNVFANEVSVEYSSHVSNVGWMNYVKNEQTSGTTGRALQMEALKIKTNNLDADINYRAHVSNVGWMKYVKNDQVTGTTGRALQMEALQIVLTGKDSLYYDVYYRTHVANIGWMNWVKNDQIAGTTGRGLRIEALQIKIVPKEGIVKPDETPQDPNKTIDYNYKSYVNGIGWQNSVTNGQTSGTENQNVRTRRRPQRLVLHKPESLQPVLHIPELQPVSLRRPVLLLQELLQRSVLHKQELLRPVPQQVPQLQDHTDHNPRPLRLRDSSLRY